jgi:aminomethyltransferase
MNEIKKTPLAEAHVQLGGRMVDFAGWWMPVQYKGLKEEHLCVRDNVGLFDVSHMGEIRVKGPNALATLEHLTTNDVTRLNSGEAQYSLLPNDQGGLVDDIIVYCIEKNSDYLVCVNASNTDKDWNWMLKHNKGADLTNESSYWAQIAIQGPKAPELIKRTTGVDVAAMKSFTMASYKLEGETCWIATTGYTGETGAEIFVPASKANTLWTSLLAKGQDLGVQPIGLGARDTLRTEMKYSLYGHEIDDTTNPYEAGLGWVIKAAHKDYMGKSIIQGVKDQGLKQQLIGFKLLDKGIPRQGYSLFSFDNQEIGRVTSGTLSPSLDQSIGIGYVATAFAKVGTEFQVDIRGRKAKAIVVKTPFISKS